MPKSWWCGPTARFAMPARKASWCIAVRWWRRAIGTIRRAPPSGSARFPGRDEPWRAPELAVFSGDIVTRDAEGFLYYVGRRDEMIKTSGYRVSPTEIEEAAYETRLVGDAVAIGLADERLGQRVVLIASPAGDAPLDTAALSSSMKQQLPLYMVPSAVIAARRHPALGQWQIRPCACCARSWARDRASGYRARSRFRTISFSWAASRSSRLAERRRQHAVFRL